MIGGCLSNIVLIIFIIILVFLLFKSNRKVKYMETKESSKTSKNINKEKGDKYELQILTYYKNQGYKVYPQGLIKGKDDGGIDLVAYKDSEALLVQCKNWEHSQIKKEHLRIFMGDCTAYIENNEKNLKKKNIKRVFIMSVENLDYGAKKFLQENKIEYKVIPYNYGTIKYDEFFHKAKNQVYSISFLNTNHESEIFCPDCHSARLYVLRDKILSLHSKDNKGHDKNCPYAYDMASNDEIKDYFDSLKSNEIYEKTKFILHYLHTQRHHRSTTKAMLIETSDKKLKAIRRKNLLSYIDKKERGEISALHGIFTLKLVNKENYAFLELHSKEVKKFYIYLTKSKIPNNIQNNEKYYIAIIGKIENTENNDKPPFKITPLHISAMSYEMV